MNILLNLMMLFMGLFFASAILIIFSLKWTLFGLKVFLQKLRHKGDIGLLFKRNVNGDFNLPKIINPSDSEHDEFKKTYVTNSEQYGGGRFFGLPYVMYPSDDTKTSIGLYYQQVDDDGNAKVIKLKNGKEVPMLDVVKPSVSLQPDLLKALISRKALTSAIAEIFQKHQTQIYILTGIGAGLAIVLYVNYEMFTTKLPEMIELLKTINVKLDTILKVFTEGGYVGQQ